MNPATRILLFGVIVLLASTAHAKEAKATSWGYARTGPVDVRAGRGGKGRVLARLGRGSVVKVYGTETRSGSQWCQVAAVSLAEVTSVVGWVDCAGVETLPLDRLPNDDALLAEVGGPYLEDTVKPQVVMARFLVGMRQAAPALICFVASPFLPVARLQAFEPALAGKYRAGVYLEFPFSEREPGITALEIRDLLGDGNECLVSHEVLNLGRGETGVSLVIRSIEGSKFKKLWEAPLELHNLASYPPRRQVLQPPERNIRAPGTVTKGEVTFRLQGKVTVPVWTGEVEFHLVGREEPVETIHIEKACPWTGTQFAPLR